MIRTVSLPTLAALLATAAVTSGCITMPGSNKSADSAGSAGSSTSSSQPAAQPAKSKVGPGMNEAGQVVDSSKVEAGYGQKVKGLGDWEGEITGKPAAGSKFSKLQIGMSMRQVTDLVGRPTDEGAYMTGKAWIPFYWGSDRHRYEMVYKGQGRLVFAGGSLGDYTGGNLIWIIHSSTEGGYR